MRNCPNCGATIEPYKCRCEYCGSWYFDLDMFNSLGDKPCYIKFKTPMGVITVLAKPELESIDITRDSVEIVDSMGRHIQRFQKSACCDMNVVFHCYEDPKTRSLCRLELEKEPKQMKEIRLDVISKSYWIDDKNEEHCKRFPKMPVRIAFYPGYRDYIDIGFDDGTVERYVKDRLVKQKDR